LGATPDFGGKVVNRAEKYRAGSSLEKATQKPQRMAAAEETREFVFQKAKRFEDEIDDLKLSLRRTEDRINEKVVRQVKEVVKAQVPPVDVGGLSLQVYRNIERIIRAEREKRGM
jgi:hypothetical protein